MCSAHCCNGFLILDANQRFLVKQLRQIVFGSALKETILVLHWRHRTLRGPVHGIHERCADSLVSSQAHQATPHVVRLVHKRLKHKLTVRQISKLGHRTTHLSQPLSTTFPITTSFDTILKWSSFGICTNVTLANLGVRTIFPTVRLKIVRTWTQSLPSTRQLATSNATRVLLRLTSRQSTSNVNMSPVGA